MESLADVVTTVFQAILAVNVVFTVGYAYNGKRVSTLSKVSLSIHRNWRMKLTIHRLCLLCRIISFYLSSFWRLLLPHHLSLGSDFFNVRRLMIKTYVFRKIWHLIYLLVWPLAVISLTTHAASLIASILSRRYFSAPGWAVESLTYNK